MSGLLLSYKYLSLIAVVISDAVNKGCWQDSVFAVNLLCMD